MTDYSTVELRGYQKRMVEKASSGNTFCVMGTGSGKTLVAAESILRYLCEQGAGAKALFLVPTIPLVAQQSQEVRGWLNAKGCPAVVGEYHGGDDKYHGPTFPDKFDVLVSTPVAFSNAQRFKKLSHFNNFGFVIFDEVHHVLKDHPYRKIALRMFPPRRAHGVSPFDGKVLGLTASLSYQVGDDKIKKDVLRLTRELQIQHIDTAPAEELQRDGYHANAGTAVTIVSDDSKADIYDESLTGVVPEAERKPHLLLPTFKGRLKSGEATLFAQLLADVVVKMEAAAKTVCPEFESPWKRFSKLAAWGEYAAKQKKASNKQPIVMDMYSVMESWYEALRILVTSWEEDVGHVIMFLRMMKAWDFDRSMNVFKHASANAKEELNGSLTDLFTEFDSFNSFARMDKLKRALLGELEQKETKGGVGSMFPIRGIVFVQNRVTAHIVSYFLEEDPAIRAAGFRTGFLYSSKSPATPSLSISSSQFQDTLQQFRDGQINLVIATTVVEEGVDVPSANLVVRFDPVLNAVSHVQGAGRSRQENSSLVILCQRKGREVEVLNGAVQRQTELIAEFANVNAGSGGQNVAEQQAREEAAQSNRERGASDILNKYMNMNASDEKAIADLNLFVKKTKAHIEGTFHVSGGQCVCTLKYQSILRYADASGNAAAVGGSGRKGREKYEKAAKRLAAFRLLRGLGGLIG